jgi:uracil phosphoribosyltransferase
MIHNLSERNTVLNSFIREIRDVGIQKDSMRFRRNLERYRSIEVETSLGMALVNVPNEQIVLASILRAGLPMHQGLQSIFDAAENAFVSAFRSYEEDGSFDIEFGHLSSPELDNKVVILADPMLASGASIELAYRELLERGLPRHIHIAVAIASKDGIEYLLRRFSPDRVTIWVAAIDDELTAHGYIVPGLGDAGDLAFGTKL